MSSPRTEADSDARRMLRLGMGIVLFQLTWFACVISAARGEPWMGIAAVALVVALALAVSTNRRTDLRLIAVALLLGVAWDSLLVRTGIVQYASPRPLSGWAPAWIVALWVLFTPMLREPLRWLHGRTVLAPLLGSVGGALSYAAAARLGACRFADPLAALVTIGGGWALMFPTLIAIAARLDHKSRNESA